MAFHHHHYHHLHPFRSLNSAVNGSVLLFTMSPSLCLVSLSVCPIVGIGSMFLSKYSRKVANTLRELEGKVTSYVLERLEGMTTVRVNNREKTESLAYEKFTGDCCSLSASTHFAQGLCAISSSTCSYTVLVSYYILNRSVYELY